MAFPIGLNNPFAVTGVNDAQQEQPQDHGNSNAVSAPENLRCKLRQALKEEDASSARKGIQREAFGQAADTDIEMPDLGAGSRLLDESGLRPASQPPVVTPHMQEREGLFKKKQLPLNLDNTRFIPMAFSQESSALQPLPLKLSFAEGGGWQFETTIPDFDPGTGFLNFKPAEGWEGRHYRDTVWSFKGERRHISATVQINSATKEVRFHSVMLAQRGGTGGFEIIPTPLIAVGETGLWREFNIHTMKVDPPNDQLLVFPSSVLLNVETGEMQVHEPNADKRSGEQVAAGGVPVETSHSEVQSQNKFLKSRSVFLNEIEKQIKWSVEDIERMLSRAKELYEPKVGCGPIGQVPALRRAVNSMDILRAEAMKLSEANDSKKKSLETLASEVLSTMCDVAIWAISARCEKIIRSGRKKLDFDNSTGRILKSFQPEDGGRGLMAVAWGEKNAEKLGKVFERYEEWLNQADSKVRTGKNYRRHFETIEKIKTDLLKTIP